MWASMLQLDSEWTIKALLNNQETQLNQCYIQNSIQDTTNGALKALNPSE